MNDGSYWYIRKLSGAWSLKCVYVLYSELHLEFTVDSQDSCQCVLCIPLCSIAVCFRGVTETKLWLCFVSIMCFDIMKVDAPVASIHATLGYCYWVSKHIKFFSLSNLVQCTPVQHYWLRACLMRANEVLSNTLICWGTTGIVCMGFVALLSCRGVYEVGWLILNSQHTHTQYTALLSSFSVLRPFFSMQH